MLVMRFKDIVNNQQRKKYLMINVPDSNNLLNKTP